MRGAHLIETVWADGHAHFILRKRRGSLVREIYLTRGGVEKRLVHLPTCKLSW